MIFLEAKHKKNELSKICEIASNEINDLISGHKNDYGLVLDSFKETIEYKQSKQKYDKAFKELREFNSYYIKTFKKEIKEERNT